MLTSRPLAAAGVTPAASVSTPGAHRHTATQQQHRLYEHSASERHARCCVFIANRWENLLNSFNAPLTMLPLRMHHNPHSATHDNKHTRLVYMIFSSQPSFITHSHASLAVIRICEIKEGAGSRDLAASPSVRLPAAVFYSHHA